MTEKFTIDEGYVLICSDIEDARLACSLEEGDTPILQFDQGCGEPVEVSFKNAIEKCELGLDVLKQAISLVEDRVSARLQKTPRQGKAAHLWSSFLKVFALKDRIRCLADVVIESCSYVELDWLTYCVRRDNVQILEFDPVPSQPIRVFFGLRINRYIVHLKTLEEIIQSVELAAAKYAAEEPWEPTEE